ncbi:DCL family protein [Streptomyces fildesensis]|uniref:DCL family protein n=1 Tax=Streptomyces fildesensis TaxID=375757 RepID=UPI0018DEF323|nr:DCL family protein [Streptomyces fildesensis]
MAEFWIGQRWYRTKGDAEDAVREVRDRYSEGDKVDRLEDQELLLDLLAMHTEAEAKIGCGVEAFVIDRPLRGKHSGFKIIRTDGSEIDFSFHACLKPPNYRQQVLSAMRAEVADTVNAYFNSRVAAGSLESDQSGAPLDPANAHVSYFQGAAFVDIATGFADEVGGWDAVELTPSTAAGFGMFTDRALAKRWHDHHKEHAVLGLLTPQENLRRPR